MSSEIKKMHFHLNYNDLPLTSISQSSSAFSRLLRFMECELFGLLHLLTKFLSLICNACKISVRRRRGTFLQTPLFLNYKRSDRSHYGHEKQFNFSVVNQIYARNKKNISLMKKYFFLYVKQFRWSETDFLRKHTTNRI